MGKVFGPESKSLFDGATDVIEIPCGSTGTFYSRSAKLAYGKYFAASWKATVSAGAPELKIEMEQSWAVPGTEGSSDTDWVEPESATDVDASLTDENWHHKAISPVAMPYIRFRITATGSNHSSCTLQIKLHTQEEF